MTSTILSKRFCVYTDSTIEDSPRIFYIGKGGQDRVNGFDRNEVHSRVTKKYGCQRTVVYETDDELAAFDVEKQFIQEFKTYAHGGDGWWGANLTLGGDGTSGRYFTLETRAKMSASAKGKHNLSHEQRQYLSECSKNLWKDQKYREKMFLRKKRQFSDTERELLSKKTIERWQNQENRDAYTLSNKARWTDERRKQHSEAAKRRWANPTQRAHASIMALKRWSDPSECQKKSEISKRLWQDPKYRAKHRRCTRCGQYAHIIETCPK